MKDKSEVLRAVNGDIVQENEIPAHNHCQGTVLSANGPNDQGKTRGILLDNSLSNMEEIGVEWKDKFTDNRDNITQDLRGILEVVDDVTGKMESDISSIHEGVGDLSDGRYITLTVKTSSGDKQFKFNTIKEKEGEPENLNIEMMSSSVEVGEGLWYDDGGRISLSKATSSILGGIKVGDNLTVTDGRLSANIPIMTRDTVGGAKIGNGLNIENGVLSVTASGIPIMSTDTVGCAKVGNGLKVDEEVLQVDSTISGLDARVTALENQPQSGVQFDDIYPVGSIYITINAGIPDKFKEGGRTWEQLATGRCLWNVNPDDPDTGILGANLNGILPRHSHMGSKPENLVECQQGLGANGFTVNQPYYTTETISSVTNISVGDTLRPPSVGVTMWKRTH